MSAVVMNTLYGSKKDQLEGLFGEFLDSAKDQANYFKLQENYIQQLETAYDGLKKST